MVINGHDGAGTALVLAASPVGKGRLIDAVSVLPALAAVPPAALTGTAAATLVELADPLEPQAVLTRLRAAVASPGPLALYITGQLHLDHKQRLPHFALARTTPSTLRYTALPWHWIAGELKLRRPGTTVVVVDLVADTAVWERLATRPSELALGYGIRVYGRIAPPPDRRTLATPDYLRACTSIWRSGARPSLADLHAQAAVQAGAEGSLLFAAEPPSGAGTAQGPAVPPQAAAPAAPVAHVTPVPPVPPAPGGTPDPLPAILGAAKAGRHGEAQAAAQACEQEALQAYGPGSPQVIHWLEVRADLARLAHDAARSCELWIAAAEARLQRQQAPDHPDVEGAVDRAHHQWEQLRDAQAARALAPALVRLRSRVPGRQRGALQLLRRRVEALHTPAPPPR
ncbi:hypothetical protein AB0A69_22885 [Streptomyces sp. NPDC045431]|uniref:hypothetical protein n=1 Tax=Streptomyces sp. NPDC045431 TaxID=3155613 RepID=UPI0033C7050E